MVIRNILVDELLRVLSELPEDIIKIDIEYDSKKSKMVIYPVERISNVPVSKTFKIDVPKIDPTDDLIDYMD